MATTLYQLQQGAIDYKNIASLYNKTFDDIKVKSESVPAEGMQFVSERSTNLETYKEGEAFPNLDLPPKNEDSARVPMAAPLEGYNQTWTNYLRRMGFIVTKSAVSRQKTKAIAQLLTGLPSAAKRAVEIAIADLFNNGFATHTGGDGSYLFATDHPHVDAQFGTWSNCAAAATSFTSTSYFTAWKNMMQRKDPKGFPQNLRPKEVYYPVALQEAVSKVHTSQKYPQDSLNAEMDDLFHNFKMVPGLWLTSDTAWFVHANVSEADKGLVLVWEVRPEYAPLSDGMNPDLIMGKRLRMSFSVGGLIARDWYGVVGS